MTKEEIEKFFSSLKTGASHTVPFSATLWADTEVISNSVTRDTEDCFTLTTYFREFWAGHGWSLEQKKEEKLTKAQLEKSLEYYEVTRFPDFKP